MMNPYRATIERLLQYKHNGIIVGGYALEFYANRYGVGIDTEHPTATLDLLGSSLDAQQLQELLSFNFDSKILVDIDDHGSPNTAVISINLSGEKEPLIIDYLAFLEGLKSKEVKARAIEFELISSNDKDKYKILVMHPLDVLVSRVVNIVRLSSKQHSRALAQVDLAIDMIHAWFNKLEAAQQETMCQEAAEEITKFAKSKDGQSALADYNKDILKAIPEKYLAQLKM
jgi:hypothetical protein